MSRKIPVLFLFFMVGLLVFSLVNTQAYAKEESGQSEVQELQQQLDIVLVLDNSGSMQKNDPQFLTKEVVTNFMVGFGANSRLAMIIFDREAKLVEPLTDLTGLIARANFLKSLDQVNYRGLFSDSPAAIERAIYELKLKGRIDALKVIILLTDGIVDTGDKARDFEQAKWLKENLTQESRNAGIKIFGIAFTDNADFSLIQTLAFKTDGEYFRAYRAEDIQKVFDRIREIISRLSFDSTATATTGDATPPESPLTTLSTKEPPPAAKIRQTFPTTEPVSAQKKMPAQLQKPDSFMLILLIGIFALLAAIVMIMALNRKTKAPIRAVSGRSRGSRQASAMPRAELIDVKNITRHKTLELSRNLIRIGRDTSNDVAIDEETVSSFHATIEYRDGFFFLEDQRSKNKTYLNGDELEPYSPKKLKSGDVVTINVYKFIFILPDLIPTGETVIDLSGKAGVLPSGATAIHRKVNPPPGVSAIPQALMIDIKNITGQKTLLLNKDVIKIGRGVHNDIDIEQNAVSGSHAVIQYKDGSFYIEDQRSKNKTFLNGEEMTPYEPVKLKSGDEIVFDVYKFIFLLEQQTPSGDTDENW